MENAIAVENEEPKHSVAVLSGTFFNCAIFLSLFIYQLCCIPQFNKMLFGHYVNGAIGFNVIFTVFYLTVFILLICNATIECGNLVAGASYIIIFICFVFVKVFEDYIIIYLFVEDDLLIIAMGVFCSLVGLGLDLRWKALKREISGIFRKEDFTIDNIKYYFKDSIFIDSRPAIIKSTVIALVMLSIAALLVLKQPIAMLLK